MPAKPAYCPPKPAENQYFISVAAGFLQGPERDRSGGCPVESQYFIFVVALGSPFLLVLTFGMDTALPCVGFVCLAYGQHS